MSASPTNSRRSAHRHTAVCRRRLRPRAVPAALAAALVLTLAGSPGEAESPQTVEELRLRIETAAASVDSLSAIIDQRIEEVTARIVEAETREKELLDAFERGKLRPSEVKTEILDDMTEQSNRIAKQQADGQHRIDALLDEADAKVLRALAAEAESLDKSLGEMQAFLQFFYAEQDSVNRLLFERLDQKPWYKSIVSDWERPAP